MKIDSSVVAMSSERYYCSMSHAKSASLVTTSDEAPNVSDSESAMDYTEVLEEKSKQSQKEQEKNKLADHIANMTQGTKESKNVNWSATKSVYELKLEILKRIYEILRNGKGIKGDLLSPFYPSDNSLAIAPDSINADVSSNISNGNNGGTNNNAISGTAGTIWKRTTAVSSFQAEYENTTFSSNGTVKTADGRTINFNVDIEMSRAYCEINQSFTQEAYILTDPLVINLDGNVASVSDQKFLFDIDSDGKEESISNIGINSGFLALDKNNDGTINDGSELFGTKSGDGFTDLSEYDLDANGWIDEADDIFQKLKIWTKNEDGTNNLISIKEAGVGALYLGNVSTKFSLNNDSNMTDAVIQSTGIYLMENGQTGTLQHVDLATLLEKAV